MPEKASVLTLAQVVVASNAFELGCQGKEKQGMDSAIIAAFLDEVEKISADLTAASRNKIKPKNFAEPKKRKYPIEDSAHARNALARVSQFGSSAEKSEVRAKVHSKYPQIGKEKKANTVSTTVGRAAARVAQSPVLKPGITQAIPKLRAAGQGVTRAGDAIGHAATRISQRPQAVGGGLRKSLAIGGAIGGGALAGHMLPQHQQQQPQQQH